MGSASAPVAHVKLATTMPTADKPHQKALAVADGRHGFVALPVHRVSPDHTLVLFVGRPVNVSHMVLADEDSAFFSAMQGVLTLFKPTLDQDGFDGTASPYIGAGIERIAQDVADQALRGNLPNQLRPLNRIGGQLDIVITKPLERLTDAPAFTKLYEYQLHGFAHSSIGM